MNVNESKCELCDAILQPGNIESHIKGKRHQRALFLKKQSENNISVTEDAKNADSSAMCNVCNVPVPQSGMNCHVNGKRHKQMLQKHKSVQNNKNKHTVIAAKPRDSSVPAGNICEICDTEVALENMESHVNSKKHKRNVEQMQEAKKRKDCGIVVTDYPTDTDRESLLQYFIQFGKYRFSYFQDNSFHIHYKEPFMAAKALSTPHYFNDYVLTVTPYVPEETDGKNDPEDKLDLTAIAKSLKETGNISEQVALFINTVRPQFSAAVEKYRRICFDLDIIIRGVFEYAQVHPFGSTITGLCFKDSDVDIFIQLPPDLIRTRDSDYFLKTARRALLRYGHVFNDILCIFRAKTPIVKCLHVPTNIKCDINFRSMLGVCNTRLISYYLSLDPKLTQLMLIIKFWAKIHDLSGPQKFTNYALTMLMFFYLQHPPFNLPTVRSLQTRFNYEEEGWLGQFVPLENFESPALRNATLLQLLRGFFSFCTTFDFGLYVVCPYIGEQIPKINFFNISMLSNAFKRYMIYLIDPASTPLHVDSAVCIQDPFELSRNVAGVVHVRNLEWFLTCCKRSIAICNSETENDFLYNLFTFSPKTNVIGSETANFRIRLAGHLRYFYDSLEPTNRTIGALRKIWFETLNTFLLSVLTRVFKLDVETEPAASSHKTAKLEGQKDVHDNNVVDAIVFRCKGKRNLWEHRKSWSKHIVLNLPPDSCSLDKEIGFTDYIYRDNTKFSEMLVDFKLKVTAKTNPTLVEFELIRVDGIKRAFFTLCAFFLTHFAIWFGTYLNEKSRIRQREEDSI